MASSILLGRGYLTASTPELKLAFALQILRESARRYAADMLRAPRSLTLVTLFFEAEIGLLALQARSLARFHAPGDFQEIVVIDNTRRGMSFRTRRSIDQEFGPWRDKVRYVRPEEIVDLPAMPGWVGQQILKLFAHRLVTSEYYVVLDAKNHWNQATDYHTFVNPDGRARGASHTYRGHALEARVAGVMRYLGVDPEQWLDHFPVTHTPVVLSPAVVAEMVAGVEARSGRPFAEEFHKADLLEFPLYASWLIAEYGTLDRHIDGSTVRSTTIWPSMSAAELEAELEVSARTDSPFLAVHRRALARASLASSRVLADLWVERQLFTSRPEALRFIGTFKVNYVRTMTIRKLRAKTRELTTRRTR